MRKESGSHSRAPRHGGGAIRKLSIAKAIYGRNGSPKGQAAGSSPKKIDSQKTPGKRESLGGRERTKEWKKGTGANPERNAGANKSERTEPGPGELMWAANNEIDGEIRTRRG